MPKGEYKRKLKYIYIEVSDDKYEFIINMAESTAKLAKMCGVTSGTIDAAISRSLSNNQWSRYQKIPIDEKAKFKLPERKIKSKKEISRALVCFDKKGEIIKVYDSVEQACKNLDKRSKSAPKYLERCCDGYYATAYGMVWRWKDELI